MPDAMISQLKNWNDLIIKHAVIEQTFVNMFFEGPLCGLHCAKVLLQRAIKKPVSSSLQKLLFIS